MLRRTFIVLGILLSIFLAVAGWLTSREVDATYPAGSHYSIGLSTQESAASKTEVVDAFDAFARDHDVRLFKIHAAWVGDESVEELIVFGNLNEDGSGTVDSNGRTLITSSDIGTRGLSGHYALGDCLDCGREFVDIAESLDLNIVWFNTRSVPALLEELVSSGIGYALFALLVLTTAVSVLWNSGLSRSRNIRVVGGLPTIRILVDDLVLLGGWFGLPVLGSGLLISFAAFFLWRGQLLTVFYAVLWTGALLLFLFVMLINAMMLYATIDIEDLARRKGGAVRRLTSISLCLRITALVLVFLAAPYSVLLGGKAQSAEEDAERWSVAQSYVKLTNNTLIFEHEDEYIARFREFVRSAEVAEHAALSINVGQMIDLSADDLAPYDQWIITDEGFLEALEIEQADMVEVAWDLIPSHVQEAMTETVDFWTEGKGLEFSLYEWRGSGSFPSLGSVAGDGNSISSTNPIVLVPKDPYRELSAFYVLSTLAANGQMVFSDGSWLEGQLEEYGLSPYISSIDNLVDEMSASARAYEQQSLLSLIHISEPTRLL